MIHKTALSVKNILLLLSNVLAYSGWIQSSLIWIAATLSSPANVCDPWGCTKGIAVS